MDDFVARRGRIARVAPLVGLGGRTAGEAVVAALCRRGRDEFHQRTAERYAEHLGRSKGVLMKAGQILSFTSAMFADTETAGVYQKALARLLDDAPPMPYEVAATMIAAELGARPEKVFAEFEQRPIGAASIGQVHAATLHDGRRVAVKVQYPGVADAIKSDLANSELLATFLQLANSFLPGSRRMDYRVVAREIGERIGEEIDYRIEADYQRFFADAYRGHPFVRIPEVVSELSTQRVLTMDLAEGQRFSDAVRAPQALRDNWGEAIARYVSRNMVTLHVFHADPHPGNYLFHDDGTVTFLDFGCVKRFTPDQVEAAVNATNAAIDGNAAEAARWVTYGGSLDRSVDPRVVLDWMRNTFAYIIAPQPFTFTPEFAARIGFDSISTTGPFAEALAAVEVAQDFVMTVRMNIGLISVHGDLRCTADWDAIHREYHCGAPPSTPMGELDAAFFEREVTNYVLGVTRKLGS